ncbi:MAG: hypothetical protein IJG51_05480 [Synergistaceae bacterium]|nr:hypothetical protein [Synergistaceae bacterium]MBQ3760365.1 hypothetical protein [Synergistaceae bacterium]MBQ6114563.1 hypothetical protein [Synergistaceae bacterium]MBQ6418816.1 hypothetical protein [Synergistaceae bacterium]MBQ6982590.1 hypothetical protein [Synergistaceae bacterium]
MSRIPLGRVSVAPSQSIRCFVPLMPIRPPIVVSPVTNHQSPLGVLVAEYCSADWC